MPYKYSNALVTGGAGFIGSHVVERLLAEGMTVSVLDNLEKGLFENISQHTGNKNFHFVRGDVRDYKAVKKVTEDADVIVHLAAMTSVPESFRKPALYDEVNVVGTLNLLKASVSSDVKSFIFASSSAVYGEQKKLPVRESNPLRPTSPYAVTKMAAERYVRLFFENYGLKTVRLRYFNVYGPRQTLNQYSGVITKFLESIMQKRPITIFGDGKQTRDFVYIKDVVEANILAMKNNVPGEEINIATGTATTIDRLAKTLLDLTDKTDIRTIHRKPRKGDIRHSFADISKAKEKLQYRPKTCLENGLRETIKSREL
jgi:UDP-glucose 4-epimerase